MDTNETLSHRVYTDPGSGFLIIEVLYDIGMNTNLDSLRRCILDKIASGTLLIALLFTPRTYLFTKSLSVIIQCLDPLRKNKGMLAILSPSIEMREMIENIHFNSILAMATSIGDLPNLTRKHL